MSKKKDKQTVTESRDIITIDYNDEMKKSYIDYAMSVIVSRALPDVRDGLKPVHRRILYSMDELGITYDKGYRKCARIVGHVLGKYHPHGDSSVYDALVRMAQNFRMGLPLVDGHGNFGSIDGDSPAAMRYTEARMPELSPFILDDLEKGVVDYQDNFDGSEKEPVVLPCRFPNLLINGSSGIAVGMATNIPPHNPGEVINAVIAYLDNNNISIEKLIDMVPAPDYPSGGIILNAEEIKNFYRTGVGKAIIRSKVEVESAGYGRNNIVVTEIPYTYSGNKTKLVNDIIELVNSRKLDELSDVRDESSKDGVRIVLEVKKGVDTDTFLKKLYTKTKLQDQESYQFLVIEDGAPVTINLKQYIADFVSFQKEITAKKYRYLLNKAEERKEILEGLVRAEDVMDVIIECLRGSKDVRSVKECLIKGDTSNITFKTKKNEKIAKTFDFTERQATAILEMRLQKLIGLEVMKLRQEYEEVLKEIEKYRGILGDEKKLTAVIKTYLREFKKLQAVPRKTVVQETVIETYTETFKEEDVYVLIDKSNYVKVVDTISVERSSEGTLNEFEHKILLKNTDKIAVFADKGNLYQVKVLEIPKCKIKDKGVPIELLCKMPESERIVDVFASGEVEDNMILITTKNGFVKKIEGKEYSTNRLSIIYTKLDEDDEVVSVSLLDDKADNVILITSNNYVLRFNADEIPVLKRLSRGVKGIELGQGDSVTEMCITDSRDEEASKIESIGIPVSGIEKKKRAKRGIKIEPAKR